MVPRKITLIRAALPITCPECGATISWRDATGHTQFLCAKCGHALRLRNNYFRILYVLAAVIVIMCAYAAGMRGDALFAIVLIGVWPTHLLLVFITLRLFPPDVESTGDFRGILYSSSTPESASTTSEPPGSAEAVSEPSIQVAESSNRRGIFKVGREQPSLEGVVLGSAAAIVALSTVWMAARPLVYRIAPELGATKDGPPAFPVKVHLGHDTIAFTNRSEEAWRCKAELGFADEYTSTFSIAAQQTRELSYEDFQKPDTHIEVSVVRDAARGKITIDCAEPSGRTHFWQFK